MRRAGLLSLVVLASLLTVSAAEGRQQVFLQFQMPSKNIACGYAAGLGGPPSLRCDVRSGLKPEPRMPCQLDWTGVSMGSTGRARPTCAGDTVADPRASVLAYGRTWSRGGFTCLSARIGLTCTNRAGHGFFLSRERWQT